MLAAAGAAAAAVAQGQDSRFVRLLPVCFRARSMVGVVCRVRYAVRGMPCTVSGISIDRRNKNRPTVDRYVLSVPEYKTNYDNIVLPLLIILYTLPYTWYRVYSTVRTLRGVARLTQPGCHYF